MPEPYEHPLIVSARAFGRRASSWLVTRERRLLIWGAVAFTVVISLIGAWKLWAFGYNSLDLAIYRQVVFNTLGGHPFAFTVHPHSYLGDHFELLLFALVPFYALLKSPFTLVVLQAASLALAVFPLARIAERFVGKPWHLLFALAFLANPVVQNMALYEFHMLPFAIPILSFALLAYLRNNYRWYLIALTLALTVREDVSFAVIGLGMLALFDKKPWKWAVFPIFFGVGWLFGALKISSMLSGYGDYKFLAYYGWLGGNIAEIIKNVFVHIDRVIVHLLAPSSVSFVIALFLPFAFLPLFKPRWLIPIIPTLLQLLLMQSPSELVVSIHYPAVFIPFLILATAAAIGDILNQRGGRALLKIGSERPAAIAVYVVVIMYTMLVIGPLAQSVPVIAATRTIADRVTLERSFVASVPDAPTAAGYETITDLSNRSNIYSLHYQFLGHKQFSNALYEIPDDTEVVLFDLRDPLMYQLLYRLKDKDNRNGYRRIRTMLENRGFTLTTYVDRFALFIKNKGLSTLTLFNKGTPDLLMGAASQHDNLEFLGWTSPSGSLRAETFSVHDRSYTAIPIGLDFKKVSESNDIENIEVRYLYEGRLAYRAFLPLGGGLYPPSDWGIGEEVTNNYRLLLPSFLKGKALNVQIRVYRSDGEISLNGVRSLVIKYRNPSYLGDPIDVGTVAY